MVKLWLIDDKNRPWQIEDETFTFIIYITKYVGK